MNEQQKKSLIDALAAFRGYVETRKRTANSKALDLLAVYEEAARSGVGWMSREGLLFRLREQVGASQNVTPSMLTAAITRLRIWCSEWSSYNPDLPQLCMGHGVMRLKKEFEMEPLIPSSSVVLEPGFTQDEEDWIHTQVIRLQEQNKGRIVTRKIFLEIMLRSAVQRSRKKFGKPLTA
jgi:hypothetical protein